LQVGTAQFAQKSDVVASFGRHFFQVLEAGVNELLAHFDRVGKRFQRRLDLVNHHPDEASGIA
jgi:hypothetical protein